MVLSFLLGLASAAIVDASWTMACPVKLLWFVGKFTVLQSNEAFDVVLLELFFPIGQVAARIVRLKMPRMSRPPPPLTSKLNINTRKTPLHPDVCHEIIMLGQDALQYCVSASHNLRKELS